MLKDKIKILYIAPFLDRSGYSVASRNYVRALDARGADLVTRHVMYDGGGYKPNKREKELASREASDIDVVISELTPNEMSRKDDVMNCAYTAWETDRFPAPWVEQLNTMDLLMVPCEDNRRSALVGGVRVPIEVIPHTFDPTKYIKKAAPFDIPGGEAHMKYLAVCQIGKKKGLDSLLQAYLSEFTVEDNVLLILKVYYGPNDGEPERRAFVEQINHIKNALRLPADKYPKVLVVHGLTDDITIEKLYATADCLALASRGEGFSITHFEGLAYGLPAIALDWGGARDFVCESNGWLVKSSLSPCHSTPHPHPFMYSAADNWAEPDILSLRRALREARSEWVVWQTTRDNNTAWAKRCEAARSVINNYRYEKVGQQMLDTISKYYMKWKMTRGD